MSSGKRQAVKPAKSDSCRPGNIAKHTGYRPTEADVAAAKEVLTQAEQTASAPGHQKRRGRQARLRSSRSNRGHLLSRSGDWLQRYQAQQRVHQAARRRSHPRWEGAPERHELRSGCRSRDRPKGHRRGAPCDADGRRAQRNHGRCSQPSSGKVRRAPRFCPVGGQQACAYFRGSGRGT